MFRPFLCPLPLAYTILGPHRHCAGLRPSLRPRQRSLFPGLVGAFLVGARWPLGVLVFICPMILIDFHGMPVRFFFIGYKLVPREISAKSKAIKPALWFRLRVSQSLTFEAVAYFEVLPHCPGKVWLHSLHGDTQFSSTVC